ncbi:CHAT domain-containing protein [Lentzea chajnantorensis]
MDDQARRAALPSLCAWAWRAVVEPLLREIGRHQPWIVLVPTGVLGVVPWHAAAGSGRTAVREAGFTYATSARQLCDLAARRRLPFDADPVVVSNPDGTLVAGQYEAQFLHRLHPGGRFYGQPGPGVPVSGPGTPDEVLAAWDGGVSLLHLGCHARAGTTPARSALVLARAELSVERVLRHAAGRDDDRAGGLVVLAACESDLTAGLHDEALTLAAAYVAIGAAGVVGTRWKVDDIESALLMCVFYDFLRSGARPRDALRSAQLWALDEDREAPEGVDTLLRGRARDRALADPVKWAAFAHHGW